MRSKKQEPLIPDFIKDWFAVKGWSMHPYQIKMFDFYHKNQSVLLIAPTGGGKTLASFLPTLCDIEKNKYIGLHTLYISPLKALTQDIHRNLLLPIQEMGLNIEVSVRTGDTSSYQRQKQLKKAPHILLTTPESLMLLLSYPNAKLYFSRLKRIIIDELHSFSATKRGDLLNLALSQLHHFSPQSQRFGLSATIAHPERLAEWLVPVGQKAKILQVKSRHKPNIQLLASDNIPYGGFKAKHAVETIYQKIQCHNMTIIFVNTRANAEFLFRQLWLINMQKIPIAIYHGSLSREHRQKTENLILEGKITAVVATSALELGIDWGNVDAVIQIGAPHGVSRLMQRIGRSNHQFDKPSLAFITPTNCFDALESVAAISAIAKGKFDDEDMHAGALDVVVQFIMNCACSAPITKAGIYAIVKNAYPYQDLQESVFLQLFQFVIDGGYTLQHYPQYHRLFESEPHIFSPTSIKIMRRHRQNIGTIIESARLAVKVLNKRKDRMIGDIEESFIQELNSGDTFLFAGEILEFIRIHNMMVETKKTKFKNPKLPVYNGGTMPLSTFLAEEVRQLLNHPESWKPLPKKIKEWLLLQQSFSLIPSNHAILIEQFPYKKSNYLVIYSFEGRRANQSLGMLLTRHMESHQLKPIGFTASDYAVAIHTFKTISEEDIQHLFSQKILYEELEKWLAESTLLKRTFRQIAIISGLIERQSAGTRKSMKQVTFSTDLIYDVLKRYEPEHILLTITRQDVGRLLLDFDRLIQMFNHFHNKIVIKTLPRPSPFSIPLLSSFKTESIRGEAEEDLLSYAEIEAQAAAMIEEIKKIV